MNYVCLNGEFSHEQDAKVSPLNRGMMYGDGCFETFKSYSGKFLGLQQHIQRLNDSLKYLKIAPPFSVYQLKSFISELLKLNQLEEVEALVRIQCWRTGERGYASNNQDCDWLITTSSIKNTQAIPLKLITAKTPVIPSKTLNRSYKLSNGINYIQAAMEAVDRNVDDAIMLTLDGHISETTISNIFWSDGTTIYTPSEDCDLLPGVTRALILNILKEENYQIQTGKFVIEDLQNAVFIFTTNSVSEVRSVISVDSQSFEVEHSDFLHIKTAFEEYKSLQLSS